MEAPFNSVCFFTMVCILFIPFSLSLPPIHSLSASVPPCQYRNDPSFCSHSRPSSCRLKCPSIFVLSVCAHIRFCVSTYLSICMSVCLSLLYLCVCLYNHVCLTACMLVCLSASPCFGSVSARVLICVYVSACVFLPVQMLICVLLCFCLLVCQSVCLWLLVISHSWDTEGKPDLN